MKNFVAFKFTDNDFHIPLREAIEYVTSKMSEELTVSNHHKFVTVATTAFHSLRRIDNSNREEMDSGEYISSRLKVSEVDRLDDLDNSFEGYVYDMHVGRVFYYSQSEG